MTTIKKELRYTKEHEWAAREGDLIVVGITDYAQDTLGDIVYVELGEAGDAIEVDEAFGVVESVKAASDLFAPLSGEIVEVNEALFDEPQLVNDDPYGDGWMIKMRPADDSAWESLLDAEAYEALLEE